MSERHRDVWENLNKEKKYKAFFALWEIPEKSNGLRGKRSVFSKTSLVRIQLSQL